MIHDPLVRLRSLFRHPLLSAYALVCGFVLLGRELDLIREVLGGTLPPDVVNVVSHVLDASVANVLISVVWPSFFAAAPDRIPLVLALATYIFVVIVLTHGKRSGEKRPRRSGN